MIRVMVDSLVHLARMGWMVSQEERVTKVALVLPVRQISTRKVIKDYQVNQATLVREAPQDSKEWMDCQAPLVHQHLKVIVASQDWMHDQDQRVRLETLDLEGSLDKRENLVYRD